MINVALFGFGRIGQMHASNLSKHKEIKILYVYEKLPHLNKLANKLYNCRTENNYKKIFSDKKSRYRIYF
jgi:glyceraldehyde-3-phosphate dehydrogenase/erythrose-4-phosphate dehydrogenase